MVPILGDKDGHPGVLDKDVRLRVRFHSQIASTRSQIICDLTARPGPGRLDFAGLGVGADELHVPEYMNHDICYLCGKAGADTRDHVPPKAFLGQGNYGRTPRITLPAHGDCNGECSDDEEYVRDLIGLIAPTTELMRLPGTDAVVEKARRSRLRAAGAKRVTDLVRAARPVNLFSPSGLYIGRGIGIPYDQSKVRRVGVKIARGTIYHDTHSILLPDQIACAEIPLDSSEP
jgi:hypothetical protein